MISQGGDIMDTDKALHIMWHIREQIPSGDVYIGYRDAVREAIRALELQIPKKPIYYEFEDVNDDGKLIATKAECPACGNEFEFYTWNDDDNHHCKCGQALDWD